ncbi:cytochrome P450 [Actinospongicola halichondriae]|uniref:cytochrome P450 n=1 Tax=Actinospongicola halichondriae TaxID=3236844 RepID=UPI003D438C14
MSEHPSLSVQDWDPRDPAFRRDPFPWYRALREQAPALEHPDVGVVLSRYEDIDRVLRDDLFGVATPNPWREVFATMAPASMRLISENALLFIDSPQHGRVRRLVSKAFSPRRVEALRPRLEAMIDEVLDEVDGASSFDLMDAVAGPFPIMAITELLNVPDGDRERLHEWTVAITAFDELPIDFEVLEAAGRAADEFLAWAGDLVELRRGAPGDDLVSALIAAEEDGEQLTRDELLAMIVLLLVAGHDTTMSLISTGILLLLQHPEAADEVREDPAAVPLAIEEILRYLGPLQVASGGGRWPAEPVEVAGTMIQPGTSVRLLLGSANRDPAVFADPDTFDIHRSDLGHLAFGKGVHFCIGAALGRLEGQIVIPTVLRRFPELALEQPQPTWRETFVTRQLATLPVRTR